MFVSAPDIKGITVAATALSVDGRVNILVHNAGHGHDCFLEDIRGEFYAAQSDMNLKGVIL